MQCENVQVLFGLNVLFGYIQPKQNLNIFTLHFNRYIWHSSSIGHQSLTLRLTIPLNTYQCWQNVFFPPIGEFTPFDMIYEFLAAWNQPKPCKLGPKRPSQPHEMNVRTRVPSIMENLENEKSIFQTWKNRGIWKKAKIMELQNASMEKSWNLF